MTTVPSLGSNGWVTNPGTMIETVFAFALTSDYSQSTIYQGEVTSIPYLINLYQQNREELSERLETALRTLYSRYNFENLYIDVTTTDNSLSGSPQTYDLSIVIEVTVDGRNYNLSRIARNLGSELAPVFEAINGVS